MLLIKFQQIFPSDRRSVRCRPLVRPYVLSSE